MVMVNKVTCKAFMLEFIYQNYLSKLFIYLLQSTVN